MDLSEQIQHMVSSALGALTGSMLVGRWVRKHLRHLWAAVHRLERNTHSKRSDTPDFAMPLEEITKPGERL